MLFSSYTIILTAALLSLQCDARTFGRRHKALAVAEAEKDIQPVTTTENQQGIDNEETSSVASGEEGRAVIPAKSSSEGGGGRLTRSRLSPLCSSGGISQIPPEKKAEDQSAEPQLARLEEEKPRLAKVDDDEQSEEEEEMVRKIRKLQKVRRLQQNQKPSLEGEDDDESLKASKVETDPVIPIETEPLSPLKSEDGEKGIESIPTNSDGKKLRRGSQKRKSRKSAPTTTTTTPVPESSEEMDDDEDDDVGTTTLFPNGDLPQEQDDSNDMDSDSGENPAARALSGSSATMKKLEKVDIPTEIDNEDEESVTEKKSLAEEDSDSGNRNIAKKSRRVYQTKRYRQNSENQRKSKRRNRNDDAEDEQLK